MWREIEKEMRFAVLVAFVGAVWGQDVGRRGVANTNTGMETELVASFVIFRHGDRTPDQEELELYPAEYNKNHEFFPFGGKALTNKGKQRGFSVGKYLRKRYDPIISQLYLPDEMVMRTTNYARTKMTALTALSALYPPPPAQRWNPALNWQPVPYNTLPKDEDDLLYYYNCPRYLRLRDQLYDNPEVKEWLGPYQDLFTYLTEKTQNNITTPEDVFFLDNLFQALNNVGIETPKWAKEVMPRIKQMTKIEYAIEFYNDDLIRLASGVLMEEILNKTQTLITNSTEETRLWLYSAHENNVAGLMAAARVFIPHQPHYGATFSLELRRNKTGAYGIMAVYAKDAGGPATVLPITGCGGRSVCDYDKFVDLVRNVSFSYEEYRKECLV